MSAFFFNEQELAERDSFRKAGMEGVPYSLPWFKARGRKIFLFGCGETTSQTTLPFFRQVPVRGLVDNNRELWGKEKFGLPVYSPDSVREKYPNAVMVLSLLKMPGLAEVRRQCREMGFETVDIWDCFLRSDPTRYEKDWEKTPGIDTGIALWREEESRRVFRDSMRYRAAFNTSYLPRVSSGPAYFRDFIPPWGYRNFVDLGAYDGDTLRDFLRYTGGEYDAYHAFEPIADFLPMLERTAALDSRIAIYPFAVSDRAGMAGMRLDAGCAYIADDGESEVETVALDTILAGKAVTYLKMDIEGAELKALRGAEGLIRSQRPVLGISAYHRIDHLWTIPEWIAGLDLGYELRLRHHCEYTIYDTICYAVPM